MTGEYRRDDSGQAHFTKEKSNNESSMGNQKHKNLVSNWCHKKGHIRADYWTRKKKKQKLNVTALPEEDEDKCDVLSVIDRSVGNKDRWIIDSESLTQMFTTYQFQ